MLLPSPKLTAGTLYIATLITGCSSEESSMENKTTDRVAQKNVCPILSSSNWRAWIDAMPGQTAPTLNVSGSVELPSAGYLVSVNTGPLDRKLPPTQRLTLKITPPTGMAAQVISNQQVTYSAAAMATTYEAVIIGCGNTTVVTISEIEAVH